MNFKPAEKMKNFEAGIFQILDKKKKELKQTTLRQPKLWEKSWDERQGRGRFTV